jgi:hypothetical protein
MQSWTIGKELSKWVEKLFEVAIYDPFSKLIDASPMDCLERSLRLKEG